MKPFLFSLFLLSGYTTLANVRKSPVVETPAVAGDYMSNVTTNGLWSDVSSWLVYDGTAWVAATAAPDASAGLITIADGDSIAVTSPVTTDQVVIENGAVLAIINTVTPVTFTLNNDTGADMIVNGKLYISTGATLSGTGAIQNNSGALFTITNDGTLAVNVVNNGFIDISGIANIQDATVTSYGILTHMGSTLNLNNAAFNNYGAFNIVAAGPALVGSTGGGSFINNAGASITKTDEDQLIQISPTVAFTNNGIINGAGQFVIYNIIANNGAINSGISSGTLVLNPAFVTGNAPVFNVELDGTGAVAGINYNQVLFSSVGASNTNITGAHLVITDNAADPIGTMYTLFSSPAGTITGPFASVSLPPTLTALTYTSNAVTVQKTGVLPVLWGSLTATARDNKVILNWKTMQENNVSHFIVEYSADGFYFREAGTVTAEGNSTTPVAYTYSHPSPSLNSSNYYRVQQVDVDGKKTTSPVVKAIFAGDQVPVISGLINPARDIISFNVNRPGVRIMLTDITGRIIINQHVSEGPFQLSTKTMPAGTYPLVVIVNNKPADTYTIIKL